MDDARKAGWSSLEASALRDRTPMEVLGGVLRPSISPLAWAGRRLVAPAERSEAVAG